MREADIFNESVFALSLSENVEVFLTTGQRTALISCVAMWLYTFVCILPILSKCGVSYRLFLH